MLLTSYLAGYMLAYDASYHVLAWSVARTLYCLLWQGSLINSTIKNQVYSNAQNNSRINVARILQFTIMMPIPVLDHYKNRAKHDAKDMGCIVAWKADRYCMQKKVGV